MARHICHGPDLASSADLFRLLFLEFLGPGVDVDLGDLGWRRTLDTQLLTLGEEGLEADYLSCGEVIGHRRSRWLLRSLVRLEDGGDEDRGKCRRWLLALFDGLFLGLVLFLDLENVGYLEMFIVGLFEH